MPVERVGHKPRPQAVQNRSRFRNPARAVEEPEQTSVLRLTYLGADDLVMNAMACFEVLQPKRIAMLAEAPDERVHRIKACMAKKPRPQFEIRSVAPRGIDAPARALPQPAPPERRFLLDVAIRARQKPDARPARRRPRPDPLPFFIAPARPPPDPLHLPQIPQN